MSIERWEEAVKKQLKKEDIYEDLIKENCEGLELKPMYDFQGENIPEIRKVNETCALVADYDEKTAEAVYAFVVQEKIDWESDKEYFVFSTNANALGEDLQQYPIRILNKENYPNFYAYSQNAKQKYSLDISRWQNAGASITQQLAVALLQIHEILQQTAETEIEVTLTTAIGENYFFEMAKIRALRILVQQMAKDAKVNISLYVFAETSFKNKSLSDTESNLIRSTLELASAMMGGADAVYSHAYTLNDTSESVMEISFKQAVVLAYESLVNVYDDAAKGAYVVEELTKQMAEKSWKKFLIYHSQGNFSECYENGILQQELEQHAVKELRWVAEKKIMLIGVNRYPEKDILIQPEEIIEKKPHSLAPHRWAEMYGC